MPLMLSQSNTLKYAKHVLRSRSLPTAYKHTLQESVLQFNKKKRKLPGIPLSSFITQFSLACSLTTSPRPCLYLPHSHASLVMNETAFCQGALLSFQSTPQQNKLLSIPVLELKTAHYSASYLEKVITAKIPLERNQKVIDTHLSSSESVSSNPLSSVNFSATGVGE